MRGYLHDLDDSVLDVVDVPIPPPDRYRLPLKRTHNPLKSTPDMETIDFELVDVFMEQDIARYRRV